MAGRRCVATQLANAGSWTAGRFFTIHRYFGPYKYRLPGFFTRFTCADSLRGVRLSSGPSQQHAGTGLPGRTPAFSLSGETRERCSLARNNARRTAVFTRAG